MIFEMKVKKKPFSLVVFGFDIVYNCKKFLKTFQSVDIPARWNTNFKTVTS